MRLIVILSVAIVCAHADKKKDDERFSPGPISSYQTKQTSEGVTVAAVPYNTEALAQTAFGKTDPNKFGILPVLVIIQNDTDKVMNLTGIEAKYERGDGRSIEATPAHDLQYAIQKRPREVPIGVSSPIPRIAGGKKNKNPLAEWEIEGRAFTARMLSPHESAYGFFYFETEHIEGSRLLLSGMREAASGKELFYFEVPLGK